MEVCTVKEAGFIEFAIGLTSPACWSMAIVPGVYPLAYLGTRYLHLPSTYYCIILTLAAIGYAIFLFLVYRLKCRIHNFARNRDGETSADRMNSDQQDERVIE